MMQQQLDIIGLRVAEMIQRIKRLQSEKVQLQSQIDERERVCKQLREERSLIRERVEKVLDRLNSVEGNHGIK